MSKYVVRSWHFKERTECPYTHMGKICMCEDVTVIDHM